MAERFFKVLFQAVMVGVSLWLLSTLLPLPGVLMAGLLMALSPWQAGLDQLLHVDGMFSTASVLTICAAAAMTWRSVRLPLDHLYCQGVGWFAVGACLALAVLTRSAGLVFLLPIWGGVLAASIARGRAVNWSAMSSIAIKHSVFSGASVGLGCVGVGFVLFPALWATPRSVASRLFGFTGSAIAEGHESVLFYNGEIIPGDPGPRFYLDVLWGRSTPVELFLILAVLGFIALATMRFLREGPLKEWSRTAPVWVVLTMASGSIMLYGAGITFAAKKFDRYFILVSPVIAILGAAVLSVWWRHARRPILRTALLTGASILVVVQGLSLAVSRPYMLDYFNPISGGQAAALSQFQLGWGQGGDEVSKWMVERAGGDALQVRSSTQIGVFTVFIPLESGVQFVKGPVDTVSAWYHTDLYVSGLQQTQRGLDRSIHLFKNQVPVHTTMVGHVTYFETYEVNSNPVPEELWTQSNCQHISASGVQLMAVEQHGDDVLAILRIADQDAAEEAWISIDDTQDFRSPIESAGDGRLVGVMFPSVHADGIRSIAIGGTAEAYSFDFPFEDCGPTF